MTDCREGYHQDYFIVNPDDHNYKYVIRPKLETFQSKFAEKLKTKATEEK